MYLKTLITSILFLAFIKCDAQDKTKLNVLDSLELFYSKSEIRKMTYNERVDAIRKMRGQNPIFTGPKFDYLGIKIIEDIDIESMSNRIKNHISKINGDLTDFDQYVFPNAYIDVLNGYFMRFYQSPKTRKLKTQDYKGFSIEFPDGQGGEVSFFSNYSKRIYYFNEKSEVVKVRIEYAFNINDGKKMLETEMQPISYESKEYYYRNDSLVYYKELNSRQNIDKYYYTITQQELDTTSVEAQVSEKYFYKYNCFLNLEMKGVFSPNNWKNGMKTMQLDTIPRCNNKYAIEAKNVLLELEEYKNNVNDYLQPTESSFHSPYEINASDD